MTPTTRHLPLHDETSGIANLDAERRREHRVIDATALLCIGMVIGAIIVSILFLIVHL